MKRLHGIAVLAAALTVAGCAGPRVVNTDEAAPPTTTTSTVAPVPIRPDNVNLVDASEYVGRDGEEAVYYFTTPSGRWSCAIVPRERAGCQSAGGSTLPVAGAPAAVVDDDGASVAPNVIVVERSSEARFAALSEPPFRPQGDPAKVLQFDEILAAAGFRCNVQESSGVSCRSEASGHGFTFDADGFNWQYTDVPLP